MKVTREEYFRMVNALLSGVARNPAVQMTDGYSIQNVTSAVLGAVAMSLNNAPEPPVHIMDQLL